MMGPSHRIIGGTGGLVAATATTSLIDAPVELDVVYVLVVSAVAFLTSTLPDDLEKVFRLDHRKVTHWPTVQISVIGGLAYLAHLAEAPVFVLPIAGVVAFACVMHSVADAMTVDRRGIQLLWPISRRGYHLLPRPLRPSVGTYSRSEWLFLVVWCAIVLLYLYARYRHQIPS